MPDVYKQSHKQQNGNIISICIKYKQFIMFPFVHPLNGSNASRMKTDPENERRIQRVLERFQKQSVIDGKSTTLQMPLTKQKVNRGRVVFTGVGFLVGVIGSFTFVHKKSLYIGKFFTLGTTALGYLLARRYEQSYNVFRYFWMYPQYPRQIQKMIDNNDSRYAHAWLQLNNKQVKA